MSNLTFSFFSMVICTFSWSWLIFFSKSFLAPSGSSPSQGTLPCEQQPEKSSRILDIFENPQQISHLVLQLSCHPGVLIGESVQVLRKLFPHLV